MTGIANYRRLRILKNIATTRKLQKNAALFQGVGAYHRKDKNPKVAVAARAVIEQGVKVRLYGMRAFAVLHFRILLRTYAWPLLGVDRSVDRRPWLLRFLRAYQALEEKSLELAQLTEPHLYAALLKKTTRWLED